APKPARVNASEWATKISGRYWEVATQEQRDLAVSLLNRDFISGVTVEPIGPSLGELEALRLASTAPTATESAPSPSVAPGPCCDASEPAPCGACADVAAVELAGPFDDAPSDDAEYESAADWPAWTDEVAAAADAEPEPAPAALTLDAWMDGEADKYRALGTDAGRLVADAIATLARQCRFYQAMTP